MLVIPKQIEFIAIKADYSPNFFIELGKYLDKKYYELKRDSLQYKEKLYLKYDNGIIREVKNGDYILFAKRDKETWACLTKEVFEQTYLILKEEEN